jgi:hypothetical protein
MGEAGLTARAGQVKGGEDAQGIGQARVGQLVANAAALGRRGTYGQVDQHAAAVGSARAVPTRPRVPRSGSTDTAMTELYILR